MRSPLSVLIYLHRCNLQDERKRQFEIKRK